GDGADLVGQVVGEQLYVAGQVLPCSRGTRDVRLTSETPFDTDFTGHCRDLVGERSQGIGHVVDGLSQGRNFAFRVYSQLLREFTIGHCGNNLHDAAHLFSQVGSHDVYVVGKILPGSCHARYDRLSAQFSVGANFASNACDLGRKCIQLVHHCVDGVLEFEDFAFHVHGDFARQVAARDRRRYLRDVSNLARKIAGHRVHGICQVLPCTRDTRHVRLTTKPPFAAHFTSHACYFGGKGAKLLDHRVQGFFELQDFPAHVHGDLARQVATGNSRRHFGNVAHLTGQVAGHEVHVVG